MAHTIKKYIGDPVLFFFAQNYNRIKELNEKYKKPRVTMTPGVRFALLMLRLYLIFLVIVLVYKFITLIK